MRHEFNQYPRNKFNQLFLQWVGGFLLVFSNLVQANWIELCTYSSLPALLPSGYLSHFIDGEQKVRLLRIIAEPSNDVTCIARPSIISINDFAWAGFMSFSDTQARRLGLLGQTHDQTFNVSEIVNIDASVTASHPKEFDLTNEEKPPTLSEHYPRAAWFWSPDIWRKSPQRIFDAQAKFGIERIYISLSFFEQQVADVKELKLFLKTAHERNLKVWVVLGDPHAVLDDQRPYFLSLVKAIEDLTFEGEKLKIDGLQLDIEPYLLPGYHINPEVWLKKQAETVFAVHKAAPSLMLDMVIPFWLNPDLKEGSELLSAVEANLSSLTVMNYRTNMDQIQTFADKFLVWGDRFKKSVYIALEFLPMPDQELRVYQKSSEGELWQIDFESFKVLILLNKPQPLAGEKAYRFSHLRQVSGSETSFFQNPEVLKELVKDIENRFSRSSSFAGVALHGLDN